MSDLSHEVQIISSRLQEHETAIERLQREIKTTKSQVDALLTKVREQASGGG
jgi:peptidoglycan hydrolase CwlO-like protein